MKYDAHASALDDAYGMLAELRRELSDTREDKNDRGELLDLFATCKDSQRAWILLEDYFNKLKLSRKDFPGDDWWKDVVAVKGKKRLEALSIVFLRTGRQMPSELSEHANLKRFNEIEEPKEKGRCSLNWRTGCSRLRRITSMPRARPFAPWPRRCLSVPAATCIG